MMNDLSPIKEKVISTGSHGNAVLYYSDEILIDVGVNFRQLEPYLKTIKIILLTHIHGDHFKKNVIKKIAKEYPNIVFGVPEHMYDYVQDLGIRKKGILSLERPYTVGNYTIRTVPLFHNVPNVGYMIDNVYSMIHATDTGKIDHIEAKGLDLYAIEHNHDEVLIQRDIKEKIKKGGFVYEIDSQQNHLGFIAAYDWIQSQRSRHSKVLILHTNSKYI